MSLATGMKEQARSAAILRQRSCASCVNFRSDPLELEAKIAGLRSFGSGFAAVRSADGLCERDDRYLAATSGCADYVVRA